MKEKRFGDTMEIDYVEIARLLAIGDIPTCMYVYYNPFIDREDIAIEAQKNFRIFADKGIKEIEKYIKELEVAIGEEKVRYYERLLGEKLIYFSNIKHIIYPFIQGLFFHDYDYNSNHEKN